jgi:hypothetical protein
MLSNRESLPDRSGDKPVELGDVEPFVLAGATHLPHRQRSRAMAEVWSCRTRRQKPT